MQIWLIRHGLTRQGEEKRYQGALDTSLSESGRRALRPAGFIPEEVYVTPLVRTQETAELLFPGVPQHVAEDLREMHFGVFEGRSWQEMAHDTAYRTWVDGNCEGRCPGGECRSEFSERVCRAFAQLVAEAQRAGKEQLVIVAHGGTQMAVLERWGGGEKTYYTWQTPCGSGWLMETESWPDRLTVMKKVAFTV